MSSPRPNDDRKPSNADDDHSALERTVSEGVGVVTQVENVDYAYLQSSPFTWFYRSVLFQMILFGALSFVGPAMSDAITNLGGGGLKTPWLANLATSGNYALSSVTTLIGGPLINKFGIKWSCIIAAIAMPLAGSSYYCSARFGLSSYLLSARMVGGIASGFLYVAEATAMMSYPDPNDRGFYLGIWSAMRNSGSVVGGAINFSTNHTDSKAGGIVWSTYLIFVGFECTGIIWAFLLSRTKKVRRKDGTKVPLSAKLSWWNEFLALWDCIKTSTTWLVALPAFYSFFCGGTMGTYLSLHFSVRARALSSLVMPCVVIPTVIAYGRLLDLTRWPRGKRAWIGFFVWLMPQIACVIWIGVEYAKYGTGKTALDYQKDTSRWAEAWLPYLVLQVTSYWCQLSLYWILGCLSKNTAMSSRSGGLFRAFETAGQAVSYGLNSAQGLDRRIPFIVHASLLAGVIPCMVYLVRQVVRDDAEMEEEDVLTEIVKLDGDK